MNPALLPVLAQAAPPVDTHILQLEAPLPPWAVILLLGAAGLASNWLLRTVLHRWAKRTVTDLDDVLVDVSRKVVPLWVLLAILYVGIEMDGGRRPRLQGR